MAGQDIAVRPDGTLVNQLRKRLAALKSERSSFDAHWRDLADYILPRRARFYTSERNKGTKRNEKIIDSTGTLAARTLSAGMMAGLTSPARPWFRLMPSSLDLMDDGAVREWLWTVETRMRDVFARSNLYDALPNVYGDLGVFGTAALCVVEDEEDIIRTHAPAIGSYYIATDHSGRIVAFFLERSKTVEQLVRQYGTRCTATTQEMYRAGKLDAWVEICEVVDLNPNADDRYADSKLLPYRLVCFEVSGQDNDHPLEESGYHEFPYMVPRWAVTGEDIYGSGPGMDALPDVRQLQLMTKRKLMGIEKMVNPPMVLSPELENKNFSLLPGALNYGRSMSAAPAAMPAHPLNIPLNWLLEDIQAVQQRIQRAMYEDLFLMLANTDRRQITAREIDERHEEKLLQLGPVLERVNDELLDPLIDRTFAIMLRRGLIPEPPEALQGAELRVEYVSIMAQAQKVVHTASVDKFLSFVGAVSQLSPGVVDKVNFDEAVDDYGDQLGISPKLVYASDEVAARREARAQQEQAQQQMVNLAGMAESAKTLADTQMGGDTALNRITKAMGAA